MALLDKNDACLNGSDLNRYNKVCDLLDRNICRRSSRLGNTVALASSRNFLLVLLRSPHLKRI